MVLAFLNKQSSDREKSCACSGKAKIWKDAQVHAGTHSKLMLSHFKTEGKLLFPLRNIYEHEIFII